MYKNYENRVKNFILDMANPDKKIIIKDISEKIETSRSKLMSENLIDKKPLIFKGYKTEKDRIKQKLQNDIYLHNLHDYNLNSNKKNNYIHFSPIHNIKQNLSYNNYTIKHSPKILSKKGIQKIKLEPIKNFERIFNRSSKKRKNLKKLFIKKNDNLLNEKNNFSDIMRDTKKEYENNNIKKISSSMIKKRKLSIIKNKNNGNKFYIRKNNHEFQKTFIHKNINKKDMPLYNNSKFHFKAAEEIAENNLTNKSLKNNYLFVIPHLFKNKYLKTNNNKLNKDIEFGKIAEKEEKKEYLENLIYSNPLKKIEKYNPKFIEELSKIAFKNVKYKDNKRYNQKNNNKKYNLIKNLSEEFEIHLDGKAFNKNNEFYLIANKILKLCKVYNNKSTHNNSYLKARNGKTMITQGLSINKFEKKYGLTLNNIKGKV